jgi:hypothetical protein
MAGVLVPADRTVNVPVVAFCRNPQCRDKSNEEFTFYVEHDNFCCPKCGADREPLVGVRVLTHLLIQHPAGPITGRGGLRFVIGCDDKRAYLATVTNLEAATDQPKIANCPKCLARARAIGHIKQRVFIVPGREDAQPETPQTDAPEPENEQ